jgi:hypothetical protein
MERVLQYGPTSASGIAAKQHGVWSTGWDGPDATTQPHRTQGTGSWLTALRVQGGRTWPKRHLPLPQRVASKIAPYGKLRAKAGQFVDCKAASDVVSR